MKALIVEDSATLCAIYEAYLMGIGLEIFAATTLQEARQSLHDLKPDFVLLDIELPDGNGLELMAGLDNVVPKPVIVVMTGHGSDWAERALAEGASDFLAKPFDSIRLRVTVQNAMRRKELNDQIGAEINWVGWWVHPHRSAAFTTLLSASPRQMEPS